MKWNDFILRRELRLDEFLQNNGLTSLELFEQWRIKKGIEPLTEDEKSQLFIKALADKERLKKAEAKWKEEMPKRVQQVEAFLNQFEDADDVTPETSDEEIAPQTFLSEPKKRGRKPKKEQEDSDDSSKE